MGKKAETSDVATQDERVMAAVAHATVIWPTLGVIAPLVIWGTQREKSDFVAFQALQAAVYHMTLILAGLVCGACYLCSYFGMMAGLMGVDQLPPEYVLIFGLLILGLAVWAAYIGYGLYGAVANLQGKDFRYAVIGPRLERYLEQT